MAVAINDDSKFIQYAHLERLRARRYDGSWTERGNSVGAPLEVGAT